MGSVSEAKYTFWHTIIGLAKASGMPKTEWCRKNCISIKTFNHYEGIFQRQEARRSSYNNAGMVSGSVETETNTDEPAGDQEPADNIEETHPDETIETIEPTEPAEMRDAAVENENAGDSHTGTDKERYFEVPMAREGTHARTRNTKGAREKEEQENKEKPVKPVRRTKKSDTASGRTAMEKPVTGRKAAEAKTEGEDKQAGEGEIMPHTSVTAVSDPGDANDAITIEADGFRLVVGGNVKGETLRSILKAVQDNA